MSVFLDAIEKAGVIGCGGAGFPAHVKYNNKAQCLIVNAAECEPLLGTDRYLLREKANEICSAAELLRNEVDASEAVIALKESYHAEIDALNSALQGYPAVRLHLLQSFYPAGDEQTLVFEVSGRTVPPGALPGAVGCVVTNAATLYAVKNAVSGRAFTQKYITVNGAVKTPCILKLPIGTSFADCLRQAGGSSLSDYAVISGGPMMGKVMSLREAESAVVAKTTSAFLVLPPQARTVQYSALNERQTCRRAQTACIQCSFCTGLCPRYLLGHPLEPHKIMRRVSKNWREALPNDRTLQSAALCCECGICELYACPMQLQPRKINALIKQEMRARSIKPAPFDPESERIYRQERKIPTKRAAARAGVHEFYGEAPVRFFEYQPPEVSIPLNSHIGTPAVPIVDKGERVELGQLIAQAPSGTLGCRYHASITGYVKQADANHIRLASTTIDL